MKSQDRSCSELLQIYPAGLFVGPSPFSFAGPLPPIPVFCWSTFRTTRASKTGISMSSFTFKSYCGFIFQCNFHSGKASYEHTHGSFFNLPFALTDNLFIQGFLQTSFASFCLCLFFLGTERSVHLCVGCRNLIPGLETEGRWLEEE